MPTYDPNAYRKFQTQNIWNPEDIWQPLYSRANYAAAGQTETSLFAVAKGQRATMCINGAATANVVMTDVFTNIEQANYVPNKAYVVYGLSIAFYHAVWGNANNLNDREIMKSHAVLHFRTNDTKDIIRLPLSHFPEINPFVVAHPGSGVTTNFMGTAAGGGFGVPMYSLGVPITLVPNQTFTVVIYSPNSPVLTNSLDIGVTLQSQVRRPT